jgi:hypothetical protein
MLVGGFQVTGDAVIAHNSSSSQLALLSSRSFQIFTCVHILELSYLRTYMLQKLYLDL